MKFYWNDINKYLNGKLGFGIYINKGFEIGIGVEYSCRCVSIILGISLITLVIEIGNV